MKRRTFAQIEQELEDMPLTSMKYRLLSALYDGLLTDGMSPDSLEKPPRVSRETAVGECRFGRGE